MSQITTHKTPSANYQRIVCASASVVFLVAACINFHFAIEFHRRLGNDQGYFATILARGFWGCTAVGALGLIFLAHFLKHALTCKDTPADVPDCAAAKKSQIAEPYSE